MRQIAAGCFAVAATVLAGDLYVSPQGKDTNPGTREQPLATLQRALAVAREAKPKTIWLAPGEYEVLDGLSLDDALGATPEAPLTIRPTSRGKARITGAKQVTRFRRITDDEAKPLISKDAKKEVLVADLAAQGFPALVNLPDQFRAPGCEEVIFGTKPMQSARWPNEGFATFTEVIDAGASDPVHWVSREVYRPGSFRFPDDRPKQWDLARGVYLHGFWCYEWADEALKVASYDAATRELRLGAKHAYGIGNPFHKDEPRQFYAIHVFEELDAPGEYYLDRQANKLFFWPPGDAGKVPTYISLCPKPLITATKVSGLVLRDLVLENGTDWAVSLKDCDHVRIDRCLVRNTGLGGITSSGGSDNVISRCEVTRTGAQAISVTAGDRRTLTKGNCLVIGNHCHHLGRYDWNSGRGVVLGGCGNRVANNLIDHCPTGGIAYSGNEHLLELNEIHHVCELYADVGVFYTGRDWASRGNVVRWNYIHDVTDNGGSGSQGIYLDDCDSGDTVVGNIVYGGAGRGVLLGGGRDNTIEGNIFIDLPKGIHVDARGPKGITLDQPGSWNLKAKCEALDYLSPLWKERYPRLARVLDENPLLPMGNAMRRNIFIGIKQPFALTKEVKEEWLDREGNVEYEMKDFSFLPEHAADGPLDLEQLPRVWRKVKGFEPIPVDKIGPKGM